ncbi:hypothetical protein V491_04492, partial [Pseudogymnoascus sp. VKM F-3775]
HPKPTTSPPITPPLINLRAPPAKPLRPPRIQHPKEDDHDSKRQPAVQRRTERHRVLGPPVPRAAPDPVVEDVAHHGPDTEIQARRRRDPGERAEEDGEVDVPHDTGLAASRVPPQGKGRDGADEETPHQGTIGGVRAKEFARADDAPEDGAVEVHPSERAREAVYGVCGADAADVGEHPV